MPEPRKRYAPFKAFGIETEIPRFAVHLIGLLAVVGMAIGVHRYYAEPEREILSLKQAQQQLAAEVEEYSLHAMEEPERHELFEDQDGRLLLRVFRDHCVLIQRQTSRGTRTKLVIDLARTTNPLAKTVPMSWSLATPVHAAGMDPCQRGCLNPHPGKFEWQYGEQKPGGWVEVWRRWQEGCTHVQMFHAPSQTWDSNPDGSPRVRWTCCVH